MDGTVGLDMSVADRVRALVAGQLGCAPNEVALGDSINDLGLDSLAIVEVIFGIEESFGITVPFNANEPGGLDLSTVGGLVAVVEGLIASR
ncbi:acyl carrier protein [Tabrizicola sp.]|uniref:acyl carrier protein n=1 Tax=Tabrizicola sp. TaxID=2005166 RepID=UPI003D2D0EB9